MFADVRHDITYPAPALILATERNNTRATEAQVGYDRGIGASSQLELLAIRRANRLHAVDTSPEEGLNEINAPDTTASDTIQRRVLRPIGTLMDTALRAQGPPNVPTN